MLPIGRTFSPGPPILVILVLLAGFGRTLAEESWRDRRIAGPFVCRADFSLDDMEGLFDDLARLQQDLVRHLSVRPAGETIELYLFDDQGSYRRFLSRNYPQVPYRRALYVRTEGVGRVFAYRSRQFAVDIRHECTHALLHAALPMVPLWLYEGLAEYFEAPPSERGFDSPHLPPVRWNARLRMPSSSLEKLEALDELGGMGGSEYRNAWAWTHFMLHGPREAHEELVGFLADIQAQTPPGSLSNRLEHRLPNLERHFAAHFRSWKR